MSYTIPFLLTLVAGLATGIGGILALFVKKTNTSLLSFMLSFSAGVMIYISLVEILPDAFHGIGSVFQSSLGGYLVLGAFVLGIGIVALIDKSMHASVNLHESHHIVHGIDPDESSILSKQKKLGQTGILVAIAIALHNLPEGMATFAAALQDPQIGMAIALAIGLHNIPEGIAVALPIYHATGSRLKAVGSAFMAGLAEPVGALLVFLFLQPYLSESVLAYIFAAVAGIMVFISFDKLLPLAREHGNHNTSLCGLLSGMVVIAISILILH